jgi:S1-C subfamily serine protease
MRGVTVHRFVSFVVLLGIATLLSAAPQARAAPPKLGVIVQDLPYAALEAEGLDYGVRVMDLQAGGPAAMAGIEAGDVITDLNERPVYSVARLRWLMDRVAGERTIEVGYARGGERGVAQVELVRRPPASVGPAPGPGMGALPGGLPGWYQPRSFLGVQVQAMTEPLRDAFGAPEGSGVLVGRLVEGSPAQEGGLVVGDIIVELGGKRLRRVDDLYRALDFYEPGDRVDLVVIHDRERLERSVTLSEPPEGQGVGALSPDALPYPEIDRWVDWFRGVIGDWERRLEELDEQSKGDGEGAL